MCIAKLTQNKCARKEKVRALAQPSVVPSSAFHSFCLFNFFLVMFFSPSVNVLLEVARPEAVEKGRGAGFSGGFTTRMGPVRPG